MKIRQANASDLKAIVAIERASSTAPHWTELVYERAIARETGRCVFVAEQYVLCGFAVAALVANEAELESVVVAQPSQRRGLGRALCMAIVDWAIAAEATAVGLEVRAGSYGAIALYEVLGFRRAGLRRDYYAAPTEDALMMRLDLSRRIANA